MKLLVYLFIFSLTFAGRLDTSQTVVLPNGSRLSAKDAIKQLQVNIKAEKKKMMIEQESKDLMDMEVCVGCEDTVELTKYVATALENMPLTDEAREAVGLEVRLLRAVAFYTEAVGKNGEYECDESVPFGYTEEFTNVTDQDPRFIFKVSDVDYQFRAAEIKHRENLRSVFLRGDGEDKDKVIKVDFLESGKVDISYYILDDVPEEIFITTNEKRQKELYDKLPELNPPKKEKSFIDDLEEHKDGKYEYQKEVGWKKERSKGKVRFGPRLEYSDYLPTNLTLLEADMDFEESVTGIKVKTETEISYKDQEISFDMETAEKTPLGILEISSEGQARYGLPFTSTMDKVGVKLVGRLTSDTDGNRYLRTDFQNLHGERYVATTYQKGEGNYELFSAEKDILFKEAGKVSIKYQRVSGSEENEHSTFQNGNSIWIGYSYIFN